MLFIYFCVKEIILCICVHVCACVCIINIYILIIFRIPKGCLPGHYISGTITFFKDDMIKKVVSRAILHEYLQIMLLMLEECI